MRNMRHRCPFSNLQLCPDVRLGCFEPFESLMATLRWSPVGGRCLGLTTRHAESLGDFRYGRHFNGRKSWRLPLRRLLQKSQTISSLPKPQFPGLLVVVHLRQQAIDGK